MGSDARRFWTTSSVRRIAGVLVAAGLVAVAGCTSPGTGGGGTATTGSSTGCPQTAAQRADLGRQMDSRISAEFALSYTDQFQYFRSVVVSVCDTVVLERYDHTTAATRREVASVTKSIVGTLVGIALADGSLKSLDQTLGELLPSRRALMTPQVAGLTLQQLLTMTAGLDPDDAAAVKVLSSETDPVGAILGDGIRSPVDEFAYSTATSHILAAILVQATGRPLLDYARSTLLDPIGVDTRHASQPRVPPTLLSTTHSPTFSWAVDRQGVNVGGATVQLTPREMLRLGQLYLDGGRVDGRQVVPAAWVAQSTRAQVPFDTANGYGYQWWVGTAGDAATFSAIGYGGQLVEVIPSRRVVAVFATDLPDNGDPVRVDGREYQGIVERAIVPLVSP